jgi:hypothetical protein
MRIQASVLTLEGTFGDDELSFAGAQAVIANAEARINPVFLTTIDVSRVSRSRVGLIDILLDDVSGVGP